MAPEKDVDGFHPCNVGLLVAGLPGPRACTPAGILELLKRYRIPIAGRRAVVVGRSDIVGKPVALLLLHEHATVTICHSKTPDLAAVCREADILVAAIGRAAMITGDYIKPGATVIDVGMNRVDNREEVARIFRDSPEKLAAFDKRGSVLVGDVDPRAMRGDRVRVHSRAGRRGTPDHRHAHGEYGGLRRAARRHMLKVGLTGGLACGKTFVGEDWRSYGCLLIQADELGHEVLAPGGEAYEAGGAGVRRRHSGRRGRDRPARAGRRRSSARPTGWRGSTAWCIRRCCAARRS